MSMGVDIKTSIHGKAKKVVILEIFPVLQPGGIFLFKYHIGEETIHNGMADIIVIVVY